MLEDLVTIQKRNITKSDLIFMRNKYKTLLDKNVVEIVKISPVESRKFRGDFYGLLLAMGIPPIIWSTILELNGLKSTNDFDGVKQEIKTISTIEAEAMLPR